MVSRLEAPKLPEKDPVPLNLSGAFGSGNDFGLPNDSKACRLKHVETR